MAEISHRTKFVVYLVISNLLAVGTIFPVLETSHNFYSAGIQLSKGFPIIILSNWLLSLFILVTKLLQVILFGELRLIEIEHLVEKSRFTIINGLIALAMFSNDYFLIPGILTLFLLFMKAFHWILQDRFDYLLQNSTTPRDLLWTKNSITLFILLYIDFNLVSSCVEYSFGNNPDVYFAFGFQFAILLLDILLQLGKTLINATELRYLQTHPDEDSLDSKPLYMKALHIIHTSLSLVIHLFLLVTFIGPNRFPLYLFTDLFYHSMSLIKQVKELRRYLKASRELDEKLQDAVEEDLNSDNNLCVICREDMILENVKKGERLYPKKLVCGHIIHMGCLKDWFERSQVCPMCRAPVFREPPTQQPPHATPVHQTPPLPVQTNQPQTPGPQPQQEHTNTQNTTSTAFSNNEPANTSSSTGANTHATNENILRLRDHSLIPPDWTLMKLTNSSNNDNQFELILNDEDTATITQVSRNSST